MRAVTSSPRLLAIPVLVTAAVFALAGCVPAEPTPTPTSAAPDVTPPATLPPTDPAVEEQGDLEIGCTELVDADAVYAFDPNFALVGPFEPDAGTAAARALDEGGVVCRWLRESGGYTIDVSAARLSPAELTELKDEAYATSEMVPTYGEEAYFDPATGTATVFEGEYWLVVTSPVFAEPGEPTDIVDSALAALAALPAD